MATLDFNSHQVEILFNSDPNPICAGTLISSYLVLTVFSCLKGKNETKLKVRTSQKDALGNFQSRTVETVHSFPAFKSEPSENDVAVILLDSDFQLGESLKVIELIKYDSIEPYDLIALSQSSSSPSSCGNIPVEKTNQSECRKDEPTLMCVKPPQQSSCPLPVPLIGSGLICKTDDTYVLCGALARNGAGVREYTDISKYLNWVRFTFDKSSAGNGEDFNHHDNGHGLEATVFKGREVSSSGASASVPYQLSLQLKSGRDWNHICGAVIIDTKTALSAAHCFEGNSQPRAYRVVAGVTQLDSISNSNSSSSTTTKQILPLQKIIQHPKYKTRQFIQGNDIAVFHVDGSFVFNENVGNIWISPPQGTNPADFTGRVSGWGKTSHNGGVSNSLQEADMEILLDSECKQIWKFLKPSMICSFDNVSNTCHGDSGGPLVIQNYQFNPQTTRDLLIGIGSFSPGNCEKPEEPNGFAKVSQFLNWVQRNRGSKCGATEFQCFNGQCIHECSLCDGIDECGDGSDEGEKQCPAETPVDLEKKASCALKKQGKCERRGGEIKNVIKTKNRKIQELEELVKTLKTTIEKISGNTDGKICLDGADSSDVTFYEDKDFSGSEIKAKAGCSCQEIPEEWKNRVSSLKSSSCVTFFRGNSKCLGQRQQLTGNQADLTSYNLDKQVSSFELCEATAERRRQQEMPPTFSSTRKETDVHSLRTTSIGVGGRLADFRVESFPYQLSLQEIRHGVWHHLGGAVLLDERTALTAAHCFRTKAKPENFRLVAGMKKLDENDSMHQVLNVTKFNRHNRWNERFFEGFDIALVTVDGAFILNEDVRPVWISSPDEPILSDFNGTATGWGYFDNSRTLSNHLKVLELPLLPFEKCKEILFFFKESMICARTGYSNICSGDNGGPLVLKNYEFPDGSKRDLLVGIGSFAAAKCEDLRQPSGFTKVSSVYDWIMSNWERNPTAPNKFKCFNGQEIEEDWRCDEEFDCADGSDERGCVVQETKDEDRPKTRGCGGEIKVDNEHDIIYRVEDSEPGKIIQCVWTIYNKKNNPMQLTLLNNSDAQFDPEKNQLIALHNFTIQNFDHKLITRTGQKRKIQDSFTTLIFRGPAGMQNSGSGFHLRLKSVGRNQEENPLKFKRMDLNATSTLQNHCYPASGFYGVNERVFTILSPSQNGNRIRMNLAFGEMEGNRDWFDVISIGQEPKSLFRLSGARSWTNDVNSNSSVIEGAPDEPLLVFMSTASPAVKRKGIRFTFSEF